MFTPDSATREAENFLRELNVTELPVDPFAIAKDLGIKLIPKQIDSEGVSGMLIRDDDQFAIVYATHIDSEGFQRFSISHEIGHYKLPGHVDAIFNEENVHQSRAGFVSNDQYEREADHFAAGLLMPTDLFLAHMKTAGEGLDAIEKLASICITSISATAIRYVQQTDIPAAVIQSVSSTIEWCWMSNVLKEIPGLDWIKKCTSLPRNTATYDFNRNKSNVIEAKRIDSTSNLQDWFNCQFDVEVIEEVKGLGKYGRTLTVLTAEEFDLEELQEEEEIDDSWTPHFRR